jgi:SOS-response transcriptional repressor LexA
MLRADRGRGEREWLEARREGRCLEVPDDAMGPVLSRGMTVAFAAEAEPPTALDGRMVVARIDGQVFVRWFEDCGDHGVLRAEDESERPIRVDLTADDPASIRRVLWIEAAR